MIKEIEYNEVFDAQTHFRTIMDAFSHPGTLHNLKEVNCCPPEGLATSTAFVALALMNTDVTCAVFIPQKEDIIAYLTTNTNVRIESSAKANFIIVSGDSTGQEIEHSFEGDPAYPETSAFVLLQIARLANVPFEGGTELTLSGPGIKNAQALFIAGIKNEVIAAIQEKNSEYPLGIDVILCAEDGSISAIPRSIQITHLKNN